MVTLRRAATALLVPLVLGGLGIPRYASSAEQQQPRLEETVTVYGERLPLICRADVPFYARNAQGAFLQGTPIPGDFYASMYWGEERQLRVEQVTPSEQRVRMTFLVDTTAEGTYTEVFTDLLAESLALLNVGDEVIVLPYGNTQQCKGGFDCYRLRRGETQVFEDRVRFFEIKTKPEHTAVAEIREALQGSLHGIFRGTRSDADIARPLDYAVSKIDGSMREAVVLVSDFGYACDNIHHSQLTIHDNFSKKPMYLALVGLDHHRPVQVLGHDAYMVRGNNTPEIARQIVERIPPFYVAQLSAPELCAGEGVSCGRVDLTYQPEGDMNWEIFKGRCTDIVTPLNLAGRIQEEKPKRRASFIRRFTSYEGTQIPLAIQALQMAREHKKNQDFIPTIDEVITALQTKMAETFPDRVSSLEVSK